MMSIAEQRAWLARRRYQESEVRSFLRLLDVLSGRRRTAPKGTQKLGIDIRPPVAPPSQAP